MNTPELFSFNRCHGLFVNIILLTINRQDTFALLVHDFLLTASGGGQNPQKCLLLESELL